MRYVPLGKSGLYVSEVSLGTMTFGRETPEEEAVAILFRYLDAGGNFIDTANVYSQGVSESILGRALQGKRDNIVLATKVFFRMGEGPYDGGTSRKHILKAVFDSLKRLQTDYIDLYQIHCFDAFTPLEETFETLAHLVERGYIRYVGVSNYTGWQITKAVSLCEKYGFPRPISAQMQYSLVERNIEYEVIPACYDGGLSIMAWGPLGGGFLSGKYTPHTPPKEGRIAQAKKDWEEAWERRATEKNFQILETVRKLAEKYGKTVPQIALNWLLTRKDVIPILGVRTLEQLEDNLGCVGWRLAEEDIALLDAVSAPPEIYPYRFIQWAQGLVYREEFLRR
ncbi:aldo/keto reductase [Candidatus Caldatribacterium sp. SIUC1]|uniref:aldo/keto reductase n=1 Tax=Candidatus Caldatribacterium sp. SIUC1 TaxID=3418365 RepID=UPI003F6944D4